MSRKEPLLSAEAVPKVRLFTIYFFVIMLCNACTNLGSQLLDTSRALHVESLGGTAKFAGFTLTLTAASATVMRILTGRTSDKVGRRGLIIAGSVIFGLSALSFNVFPSLGALSVINIVRGAGMSIASTTISVAITDVIPKERMAEGLGYFGLTQPLTNVVGPGITAGLIAAGSFSTIFYIAAGIIFAVPVVMLFCNYEKAVGRIRPKTGISDETTGYAGDAGDTDDAGEKSRSDSSATEKKSKKPDEPRGLAAYFEKSALPCSAIMLFTSMAQGANLTFLMAYAFHIGVPNPVLYYTLSAVFMVCFRLFTGRLADRFKPVYMIVLGIAINAAAFTCLMLAPENHTLFYIAGATAGVANGISGPVMQATVVRMAPESRRGAAMATYIFPLDVGLAVGSFVWGVVVDNSGYRAMYAGSIGCLLAAIALAAILLRKVGPARASR